MNRADLLRVLPLLGGCLVAGDRAEVFVTQEPATMPDAPPEPLAYIVHPGVMDGRIGGERPWWHKVGEPCSICSSVGVPGPLFKYPEREPSPNV